MSFHMFLINQWNILWVVHHILIITSLFKALTRITFYSDNFFFLFPHLFFDRIGRLPKKIGSDCFFDLTDPIHLLLSIDIVVRNIGGNCKFFSSSKFQNYLKCIQDSFDETSETSKVLLENFTAEVPL